MRTIENVEFWGGTGCMVVLEKRENVIDTTIEVFSDMEGGENKVLCVEYYYGIGY